MEDSGRPVLIGYWKGHREPDWPDPRDFVHTGWDAIERREVAAYLSNGTVVVTYRGLSSCRFCGQSNGHREFTDGTYQWPEGLAHYVWVHEVRLPVVVVTHIKSRLVGFNRDGLDREWWRRAHLDPHAAISTPPYTAIERFDSEWDQDSATSTPPAVKGSARVRLESAVSDWFSQRQSEGVIWGKADRFRSALEVAKRLGEVTDEDVRFYTEILTRAAYSGTLRPGIVSEILAADEDSVDGTDRTI